jgi:hypothetical protein
MSNVLDQATQQQILALGRLGWSLRRIEQALSVRRETISGYLKAAGIPVPGRGRRSESTPKPAISAQVSTDSGLPKPATRAEVSTDLAPVPQPGRAPSASACEPYRELIERARDRGRNAMAIWQDLVDTHGFSARYASVRASSRRWAVRRRSRTRSSRLHPARNRRWTTATGQWCGIR